MFNQLETILAHYNKLSDLMAQPEVVTDHNLLRKYGQEQSSLSKTVELYKQYLQLKSELEDVKSVLTSGLDDPEEQELFKDEKQVLTEKLEELSEKLRILLIPKDPNDDRNVIVEIRAGAGGNEAGLFAADLFRMYGRYAEKNHWKTSLLNSNESGIGGFKEVIFKVAGKGAYSKLKYESGVHRVQRVPDTESSGRIHTSTATVAVLPEMEDVEVEIDQNDIRLDIFRSSGPGGQSVNTTDSAIRLTHIPTGITVSCQDEKSQLQNRIKAMTILRAKLYDIEQRRLQAKQRDNRRSQIGTGDRSEKIRTYNFPQTRITDHRVPYTSHRLSDVLDGELNEFIEVLTSHDQTEKLKNL
ncbi:MAG: peptide chain release factor 1 [Anaerolineaceae bacterium 4572_78]|nr:MAG: peptide chain release factor 1 [Anaerolineaceae bacterium 4572_78]